MRFEVCTSDRVRSRSQPSAEDAARGGDVESFRAPSGATITTNNPLVVAALRRLSDVAPEVVAFDDLRRHVDERLAASSDADIRRLGDDASALPAALLQCATAGLVDFRALPSRFVVRAGPRPKASALARWQALHVAEVTTLGHWPTSLLGAERFVLPYLDGANDRSRLDSATRTRRSSRASSVSVKRCQRSSSCRACSTTSWNVWDVQRFSSHRLDSRPGDGHVARDSRSELHLVTDLSVESDAPPAHVVDDGVFRIAILGDFGARAQPAGASSQPPLARRRAWRVDRDEVDSTLAAIAPTSASGDSAR